MLKWDFQNWYLLIWTEILTALGCFVVCKLEPTFFIDFFEKKLFNFFCRLTRHRRDRRWPYRARQEPGVPAGNDLILEEPSKNLCLVYKLSNCGMKILEQFRFILWLVKQNAKTVVSSGFWQKGRRNKL